jgi:hypothetical protein
MTAARVAGLLGAIGLAGLFASCGEWIVLGPLVECGRKCRPPQGACELGIAQYNRIGECVCGEVADCPGYVCEPSPPIDWCYIAQFNKKGECECLVPLQTNACGQPCEPPKKTGSGGSECDAGDPHQYDGRGNCVCAPAKCPCGQPCLPPGIATCPILHHYNDEGHCVCAPVNCSACDQNPCCDKTCGEPCELSVCGESGEGGEGGESCIGQCDKANHCVSTQPDCDPIPK